MTTSSRFPVIDTVYNRVWFIGQGGVGRPAGYPDKGRRLGAFAKAVPEPYRDALRNCWD
jgi:hypothetical protein